MSFRLDLHVHTLSRGKLCADEKSLGRALKASGLSGIAVTNFFDIDHGLWLRKRLPEFVIIPGQEIWTTDGHVIALGVRRCVRDCQSAEQTIADIHEQGALAVAVHPFMFHGVGKKAGHLPFDAIEVYNALIGQLGVCNYLAERLAKETGRAVVASSDVSLPCAAGTSSTEVDVKDRSEILPAIKEGKTRLFRKALPLPWRFAAENLLPVSQVRPWRLHEVPCPECGDSWVLKLMEARMRCLVCGKAEMSRVRCSNGHYQCMECLMKRSLERAQELRERQYQI